MVAVNREPQLEPYTSSLNSTGDGVDALHGTLDEEADEHGLAR
jgi:hypothetical protein